MNDYPLATGREMRHARKRLNLGEPDPKCAYCHRTDILYLFRPRASAQAPIRCRTCHSKRKRVSAEALARKRATFAAAGYPEPACVACSERDLRALELDHLAGEANSPFVEPLCLNCHAMKSDDAEDEPWASLRLRDPERGALALQAAVEFGAAGVLTIIVAHDGEGSARAIFLLAIAAVLVAWALWNLKADSDLRKLGPGTYYGGAITAEVPS